MFVGVRFMSMFEKFFVIVIIGFFGFGKMMFVSKLM